LRKIGTSDRVRNSLIETRLLRADDKRPPQWRANRDFLGGRRKTPTGQDGLAPVREGSQTGASLERMKNLAGRF
jgi:hypothetical protein